MIEQSVKDSIALCRLQIHLAEEHAARNAEISTLGFLEEAKEELENALACLKPSKPSLLKRLWDAQWGNSGSHMG